jgi:uncharacterized protein (TIGR02246 family)
MDMSSDSSQPRLLAAIDEVEIRALMDRYFHALDARDWPGFQDCFAEEAVAIYHHGTGGELQLTGNKAITDGIRGRIDSYAATVHANANVQVEIAGDRAKASTHAIANVVLEGQVLVRGLRYVDELERRGGRWLITRRTHIPMWQYEAAAVKPSVVHRERNK